MSSVLSSASFRFVFVSFSPFRAHDKPLNLLSGSFSQIHPKIRRAEIDPMQNLGVLLIEIFELYGKHFGYDETGITLRDGGTYFSKVDRGWQNERQKYLLSIEDPQDPSESSFPLRLRSSFSFETRPDLLLAVCSSLSQRHLEVFVRNYSSPIDVRWSLRGLDVKTVHPSSRNRQQAVREAWEVEHWTRR